MSDQPLCYLSLQELSRQLHAGKISSAEATRTILDRIRVHSKLNAYITVMNESATRAAANADEQLSAGRSHGPLHGVPIGVKDLCFTKGVRTTCASGVLRDWIPNESATVIERLEAAGAIIVGKLHMTEFATVWYHPEFPSPKNPWGDDFWPGASSSGSGAATAAGLCYGSLGSDTGGSIRLPSAANGIVGLKPTWGRVSRHGVFPLAESLDHIGPMTRTVTDAALMLSVIAGYDFRDQTSLTAPVENYSATIEDGVNGLRIGLDEAFITKGTSAEVSAAVVDAIRTLERLGARIIKVSFPAIAPVLATAMNLLSAETAVAHEATYPSKADRYGAGFRSLLEVGAKVRGQDYAKGLMERMRFANQVQNLFDQVDVFACPSMSSASLPANAVPADARSLDLENEEGLVRFTMPFDLSRNPTLSLPCGKSPSGPPPSLQLIGRLLGEATILRAGRAFERATEWNQQTPPLG
jgi:amidase